MAEQIKDKTICYSFASRSRPEKFFNCLNNIREMSASDNYFVVAKIDLDDESMCNHLIIERIKNDYKEVIVKLGTSKSKVNAINRDLNAIPDYHIMMCESDDMLFTKKGFDNDVRKAFEDFSGLVHFPDQHVNEKLCTYSMIDKKYYERFGYIYNPEYISVYCDNEQQDVAKILNQYKYVNENILIHNHSVWGYDKPDELRLTTESANVYKIDRQTYIRRKANNFGL